MASSCTIFHLSSIWLGKELSVVKVHDHRDPEITQYLIACAMVVDFLRFPEIRYFILRVLDLRPKHTTGRDYHRIEDSGK